MKSLNQIMAAITAVTGVTYKEIKHRDRKNDLVRGVFYLIAHKEKHTQASIAKFVHRARVTISLVLKTQEGYYLTKYDKTTILYNDILEELYKDE